MAWGKTPSDEKKQAPEPEPVTKPDSDRLADLIDRFAEEVEPVAPADDAGKDSGTNSLLPPAGEEGDP